MRFQTLEVGGATGALALVFGSSAVGFFARSVKPERMRGAEADAPIPNERDRSKQGNHDVAW